MLRQPDTEFPVQSVTLENDLGFGVEIADCGASLKSLWVPVGDRRINVVLGYDAASEYANDTCYMGSTLGRYANRISGARFTLGGKVHRLVANEADRGNCLHGGPDGFHHARWMLEHESAAATVTARLYSPDGAGGFPGNLNVSLVYQLLGPFSLALDYEATTDADTILSLSNHAYFNLDAEAQTVDTHTLTLAAEQYTPVDEAMIPTGEIRSVKGTEFDFRSSTFLANPLTGVRHRLDTNFVTPPGTNEPRTVARLEAPNSDLQMLVHTTQPGFQVYTGDHLAAPFEPRQGICIETQNFPDAPNQAGFPSPVLRPGETYRQRTIYEFRIPSVA